MARGRGRTGARRPVSARSRVGAVTGQAPPAQGQGSRSHEPDGETSPERVVVADGLVLRQGTRGQGEPKEGARRPATLAKKGRKEETPERSPVLSRLSATQAWPGSLHPPKQEVSSSTGDPRASPTRCHLRDGYLVEVTAVSKKAMGALPERAWGACFPPPRKEV